ncbi:MULTISPECIES: MraY family glycosyltransferase [Thermomonospora]|uniref:Glycosyl transferase family 4 n=1 Tax=Thermomonospora curvata (strain ATCC 19995 / DSM 43183 / JCM 3096 / KCTC 9072 / NBRC 15933 / NCIMB 10081 / Henssen B9) TaxID=471852 RepID=D1AE28_THECD|nr:MULTISPECIES: MraY family glycosyltransferase [Thermomonospora]ACY99454.1 glycosyl transferase family 4 [Thermomonospora curvata DSM 43183]PKK12496.1 MAG: undecaprenyl/decaprenyl-phosphate alpha-N-acetylglucosaminyl 1-phosphate transferase [Thermomonospora sp. CIF 1]
MREYLLIVLVAAVITYLTTPLVRALSVRFGAMTAVRDRDVHAIPTPRMGGLAMFFGMIGALVVASGLPVMRKVMEESDVDRGLLLAGGLIVLLGIADDRWEIDALTKFAGQVAAAGLFILNGIQLFVVPLPNGQPLVLPPEYGVPLTIFLVVATINAVNFVDGLDGLAAGVVGIAAMALFSYASLLAFIEHLSRIQPATLAAAVLIGICAGFLPHNFNPARIFMGDTGSMLIGLLLSAVMILLTGQFDSAVIGPVTQIPFFLPLVLVPLVVAVPYIDMLLAVWRRTNQGKSPFAPDKLHLHHRLLELGHSHRRAVLVMYFWVGLLASCVVGLSFIRSIPLVLSVTGLVAIAGVVGLIAEPWRRRRPKATAPDAAAPQRPREHV